jgi:uncharacterized protein
MRAIDKADVIVLWAVLLPLLLARVFAQTMSSPPFFKTSFDCAKVKVLSTEEAICKNEDLAKLDVQMAEAYRKRLNSANDSEKPQVIASQRKWLIIRNSYNVNPYHGDPPGARADLEEFYKQRITALRSGNPDLLTTDIPKEYGWLQSIAPEGFSKEEFSIGRAYAGCADPCRKQPSLYRWISIGGGGIGDEPGDVDTPYAQLVKRLAAGGWTSCREADDSGKPTIDYFTKGNRMVSVSRYYSMGAGNGIGVGVTISGPLPQPTASSVLNPTVAITDDWDSYSSADIGLKVRFPPDWHMRDANPNAAGQYKYLMFGADDFKPGDFRITVKPIGLRDPNYVPPPDAPKCSPSHYRISGLPAQECLIEDEVVSEGTCNRYLGSIIIRTSGYELTFEPSPAGSFPDNSGHYTLTDLYEKIMSTIRIGESKQTKPSN